MQLETLAFTASTHLAAAATTKATSSPSPRLPPPPLATKRVRQNLGATNRSSANLAVASPRARKPVERRETDPHARMPYVSPRRLKAMLKDDGTARIHDTFRSFDWNGSGSIDRKELKEVLQELRLPCDGARVRAALRKYDEDGSGVLEKDELVKLVFELREDADRDLSVAAPAPAPPPPRATSSTLYHPEHGGHVEYVVDTLREKFGKQTAEAGSPYGAHGGPAWRSAALVARPEAQVRPSLRRAAPPGTTAERSSLVLYP